MADYAAQQRQQQPLGIDRRLAQHGGSVAADALLRVLMMLAPVQLCRAEHRKLVLMSDGVAQPEVISEGGVSADDLAGRVFFGLYEAVLNSWTGLIRVVSVMGKTNSGKSETLNNVLGTYFTVQACRCTDGAWMSMRVVSSSSGEPILYIVLDFEGQPSLAEHTERRGRSAQRWPHCWKRRR